MFFEVNILKFFVYNFEWDFGDVTNKSLKKEQKY